MGDIKAKDSMVESTVQRVCLILIVHYSIIMASSSSNYSTAFLDDADELFETNPIHLFNHSDLDCLFDFFFEEINTKTLVTKSMAKSSILQIQRNLLML